MEYIGKIESDRKLYINESGIVIFGVGREFTKLLGKLEKICLKDKICCICDNNSEKQGKEIKGIKIVSPDYAFRCYRNSAYIVYNQFRLEICKQLIENGIKNIHLIRE